MRAMTIAMLVALMVMPAGQPRAGRGAEQGAGASPATLAYVESSTGLIPPELEGGRTEIEMSDVNDDGHLDLVSIGDHGSPYVNTDEHGIMVWFGDGTGTWSVYQNGEFGYGGIALGDVNGDGLMDAAYGMHHNYSGVDFGDQLIEVALGDGTGQNWTPWDDGLATNGEDWGMFSTDLADVDNDGDLDVGSLSFGCCNGMHVYLNQGDGTWQQSFSSNEGNSDMQFEFGDVNGDGNADLAGSNAQETVYLGDGSGAFAAGDGNLPPLGEYDVRPGVSLGDVTGDGRDELAFCNPGGGPEVWTWTGPGTWQDLSGSLPAGGPYEATQLFDMDMDGHVDLVAFGNHELRIWGGDGAGNWTELVSWTTPTPGEMVALRVGGDADNNGFPDVVLAADEGSGWNYQNHLRFYRETSIAAVLEIKPVFPHGGEVFRAGSVVFVDWLSAVPGGGDGTVMVELSIHGPEGPWQLVAAGLANSGRFQWRIPPDTPSTDEAMLRYTLDVSGEVTSALSLAPFHVLGAAAEPIEGLAAANDSPTPLGRSTTLTATVEAGTAVQYEWVLGDGSAAEGATVLHTYPTTGTFTAVVTATNSVSQLTAATTVTVTEPRRFVYLPLVIKGGS